MIILTAGNSNEGDHIGRMNDKFSFRSIIIGTMENASKYGYRTEVYDLGKLGIGEPYNIEDETFRTKGYFTEISGGYRSKSLFKPDIVKHCLEKHREFTVYLDGDALLCDRIDEVATNDYDIGVTLRRFSEIENEWHKENIDIVKYVNAGVIFFNPTEATSRFVDLWMKTTVEVKNDQKALNQLVCPDHYPETDSIHTLNGVRIKYFSGDQYNFYYFDESLSRNIKILHFKGPVRWFYPFDWKMKLYCSTIIPLTNRVKTIVKKIPIFKVRD